MSLFHRMSVPQIRRMPADPGPARRVWEDHLEASFQNVQFPAWVLRDLRMEGETPEGVAVADLPFLIVAQKCVYVLFPAEPLDGESEEEHESTGEREDAREGESVREQETAQLRSLLQAMESIRQIRLSRARSGQARRSLEEHFYSYTVPVLVAEGEVSEEIRREAERSRVRIARAGALIADLRRFEGESDFARLHDGDMRRIADKYAGYHRGEGVLR